MTEIIAVLLIVFASLTGLGHAAEIPTNEQPMYGNGNVSPEAQRSNKAFFESTSEPNWKLVSNKAVDIGWRAIGSNDLGKAMRRFNQGWLLDPHNGRVYWGFAVVLQIRDNNLPASIKMSNRARKLLPNDPALLLDYGRILEGAGQYEDGIIRFKAALAMDENIPPAYYGLVRAYLGLKNIERAAHFAKVGQKFGISMTDREIEQLQQQAKQKRK